MAASELPTDLVRAQGRFEAWRKLRKKGNRIPQSLWRLAVRLASSYSIHRTATALKLDYYSLKQQVEAAGTRPSRTVLSLLSCLRRRRWSASRACSS